MKKLLTFISLSQGVLALLLSVSVQVFAQETETRSDFCGTDLMLTEALRKNPALQEKLNKQNEAINDFRENVLGNPLDSTSLRSSNNTNYTIPLVVYIVHDGGPENISDQQIFSQISKLNDEFSSHGIGFCLATSEDSSPLIPGAPPGVPQGIIRIQNSSLTSHEMDTEEGLLKATSQLPSDRYLRIWVVKDITHSTSPFAPLGYSNFPGGVAAALEGIVMRYDAFGDIIGCSSCTNLLPAYNQGKILAHEVGHYLDLYHTFHGGCVGSTLPDCNSYGDMVCDTPPAPNNSSGCPTPGSVLSCDGITPVLLDNHMEYTDDNCRTSFTLGQEARMVSALNLFRSTLVSSANLIYTGINCNGGILAVFSADNFSPCVGDTVTFTANTVSGASYTWDFGDGSPFLTGNPISHTYTTAGTYYMTLTVTSGTFAISETKPVYVSACSPISSTQGNWYFYNKAGLDFSSGIPTADDAAFNNNTIQSANGGVEACAIQNDPNGNLLFYTDAMNVWDENHLLINPSSPLLGYQSAAEGTMILPDPGNSNEYYIFTTTSDHNFYDNTNEGFRYSKVQVAGTAASMTPSINIPVIAPAGFDAGNNGALLVQEGITAIAACDGYWVICSGRSGGNLNNSGIVKLAVFKLSSTGILYHSTFTTSANSSSINYNFSVLEASPDGSKIALGQFVNDPGTKVYDFNNTTGIISNELVLNADKTYGLSFSPNSQFLYTSSGSTGLYQYDMSAVNPATSGILVSTNNFDGALQAGPDGKIYGVAGGSPMLVVIHQPDIPCTTSNPNACLFDPNGPALNTLNSGSAITGGFGLPNMLDANAATVFSNAISCTPNNCFTYEFAADICATTYTWDFGDPASGNANNTSTLDQPIHLFSGAGTYVVSLNAGGTVITKTITVGFTPIVSGPTSVCPQDSILYNYSVSGSPAGSTYDWSTSAGGTIVGFNSNSSVDINWTSLPGILTLVVTDPATGCTETLTQTINEFCQSSCEGPAFIKTITCEEIDVNGFQTYALDIGLTNPFSNTANVTFTTPNGALIGAPVSLAPGYNSFTAVFTEFIASSNLCINVFLDEGDLQCTVDICIALPDCDLVPCEFSVETEYTYSDESPCTILFSPNLSLPTGLTVVSWSWDFGDGMVSGLQNPSHFFSGGTYNVCLTVIATNGTDTCSITTCSLITTENCESSKCKVKANFSSQATAPCTFQFTDLSAATTGNYLTNWEWTVNGVLFSTQQNPSYTFPGNGTYEVCLKATASSNLVACQHEVCFKIKVTNCLAIEKEVFVYPNPSSGRYYLNVSAEEVKSGDLKLYNLQGIETPFVSGINNDVPFIELNISGSGVYLLRLRLGTKIRRATLIKH